MSIRNFRERVIQATSFEVVGVLLFTNLLAFALDREAGESMILLIAMSVAAVCLTGGFNHVFDTIEYKRTGRVASDRPQTVRVIHTVLLECVIALATIPMLKYSMDLSWTDALLADIVLLVFYAGYGYVFHVIYDRLRPVRKPQLR